MYVQTVQTVQTYGTMEQRLKGWCWAVSGFWNSKKGTSLCKHAGACMKMSREFKSLYHFVFRFVPIQICFFCRVSLTWTKRQFGGNPWKPLYLDGKNHGFNF